MNRRRFVELGAQAAAAASLTACDSLLFRDTLQVGRHARLKSRPSAPTSTPAIGLTALNTNGVLDAYLYVPTTYDHAKAWPLVMGLHGAYDNAQWTVDLLQAHAEQLGFVLLAIDSRSTSWDGLTEDYGRDIVVIERCLKNTFSRCRIDSTRTTIAGFSDGGSYSLALGITNGDLFSRVVAFSPGSLLDAEPHGHPRFFESHGTRDAVLPIDSTSRSIVPTLRNRGYSVDYVEFDGNHWVPPEIAEEAMRWVMGFPV